MWPVGVLWEWMAPLKQSGHDIFILVCVLLLKFRILYQEEWWN
jgi:hypothetical protein